MILELIAAGLLAAAPAPAHVPGSSLSCAVRQISEQARRDFRAAILAGGVAKFPRETYVAISAACPVNRERSEAFGAAIAAEEITNFAADELIATHGFTGAGIQTGWDMLSDAEIGAASKLMDTGPGSEDEVTIIREAVTKFALAAQPGLTRQSLGENEALAKLTALYVTSRSYRDKVAPTF